MAKGRKVQGGRILSQGTVFYVSSASAFNKTSKLIVYKFTVYDQNTTEQINGITATVCCLSASDVHVGNKKMAPEEMAAVLRSPNQLCYYVGFFVAIFVNYFVHNVSATVSYGRKGLLDIRAAITHLGLDKDFFNNNKQDTHTIFSKHPTGQTSQLLAKGSDAEDEEPDASSEPAEDN